MPSRRSTLLIAAALAVTTLGSSTAAHLQVQWRTKLGDVADSAPIVVRNMLYITARNGTTYGIDTRAGRIVWRFSTSGPGITTSRPVADPSRKWIYAPGVDGFVHKLDAASGAQIHSDGFPVRITRIPGTEKDASNLTFANGYVYAVTSGYFGDAPPYVGHLVAIRTDGGSAHVFNTLCSDDRSLPTATSCAHSGSGIWARAGAVPDPDPSMHGTVYIATGNGDFDANSGGHDYGDSVLAVSSDGTQLLGYYTPSNYAELDSGDVDLGSTAPAPLPQQPKSRTPLMLVQGGKDGMLRLLDRKHLGGVGAELERVDVGSPIFTTPAVWSDDHATTWIYLGMADGVQAYQLKTGPNGKTRIVNVWTKQAGEAREGSSPAVSNGVLFLAMDGTLYAMDARSGRIISSASIGEIHWESPVISGNSVYCSDEDGRISAFAIK